MAEQEKQALKKLEEEITCAICLNDFQDPKLLPCFHIFCWGCLKKIVKGEQGTSSLCCPTCRHLVPIAPGSDVSSFPAAFYIHHLFEIKSALVKVKEPQTVKCQKCTKSTKIACMHAAIVETVESLSVKHVREFMKSGTASRCTKSFRWLSLRIK